MFAFPAPQYIRASGHVRSEDNVLVYRVMGTCIHAGEKGGMWMRKQSLQVEGVHLKPKLSDGHISRSWHAPEGHSLPQICFIVQ